MSTWTVIVAAGAGSRFGRLKQYELLAGRRVLDWSIAAARAVSEGVVLVVPRDAAARDEPGVDAVVAGGATRSQSVRAGLAAVPADASVVLVHDGARPCASVALFERVVAAVEAGAPAVIPGVRPASTITRVDDHGLAVETLDRDALVEVQTPQAFAAGVLRSAHAEDAEGTDDASLVAASGVAVTVVEGEPTNLKITHPHDLEMMRALLAAGAVRPVGAS